MKTTKETSYEDGMAIAENYAKYEREIAELKKQIAELQLLAGVRKLFLTDPLTKNKGA